MASKLPIAYTSVVEVSMLKILGTLHLTALTEVAKHLKKHISKMLTSAFTFAIIFSPFI